MVCIQVNDSKSLANFFKCSKKRESSNCVPLCKHNAGSRDPQPAGFKVTKIGIQVPVYGRQQTAGKQFSRLSVQRCEPIETSVCAKNWNESKF